MAVMMDFYQYFSRADRPIDRRTRPDDLASLIANGEIRGEPMPDLEKLGYYLIIATAGHDTTSAAMAEGMAQLAAASRPARPAPDPPALIGNAVEEMIRLASSVRHFMRTATEDTEIAGQRDQEGRLADAQLRRGEPRPEPLRTPARIRRHQAECQQADRLRVRHPLLPRRPTRPHGTALAVLPSGTAAGIARARRRSAPRGGRRSSAGTRPCRSATPSRRWRATNSASTRSGGWRRRPMEHRRRRPNR